MNTSINERERESVEECDVITVRCTGSPSAGSENGVITNSIKPFILLGKIKLLFKTFRLLLKPSSVKESKLLYTI